MLISLAIKWFKPDSSAINYGIFLIFFTQMEEGRPCSKIYFFFERKGGNKVYTSPFINEIYNHINYI